MFHIPYRFIGLGLLISLLSGTVGAHGVAESDAIFLEQSQGSQVVPFLYLGAKHMVTGYDHLLFLLGVIFFLYRLRDVGIYVTLFAVGHSITLLAGVLSGWHINPFLIDTIIGFSIVYKALDNLGAFERWLGFSPDNRKAVFLFGLCHGLGLATKLQDFTLSADGLVTNIIAFNVGVEVGQLMALWLMLILITLWRKSRTFDSSAFAANVLLMGLGFVLMGYQSMGLWLSL